jgi:NAD(P)-dependent dehydrogenase (short-subunit alcohol dehydrogenase family)
MAVGNVDMSGKNVVVTGATGGIGKEIARGLARMGATLVIGARSQQKGESTRAELEKETGNKNLSVMVVDVADPKAIGSFADAFRARFDKLHVLVNNAGAWFSDRRENPTGHELTFATNVLGPHLLTRELIEPLRRAAPSRVINIVSAMAGNYDASDLEYRSRKFDGFKAYAQTKLALRMLTWGQAARLQADRITVNAAAPGFVRTDFNQNARGFTAGMITFMSRLFGVTAAKGAETPLWAATAPELETVTGKYFDAMKEKPSGFREPEPIADLERRCDAMLAAPAA